MVINARQVGVHRFAMRRQPKPFDCNASAVRSIRCAVLSLPMHVNPFSPLKHLSPSFHVQDSICTINKDTKTLQELF
jgi:hypothetical protein